MLHLYENVLQPNKVSCLKRSINTITPSFRNASWSTPWGVFLMNFRKPIQLYSKECYNSLE